MSEKLPERPREQTQAQLESAAEDARLAWEQARQEFQRLSAEGADEAAIAGARKHTQSLFGAFGSASKKLNAARRSAAVHEKEEEQVSAQAQEESGERADDRGVEPAAAPPESSAVSVEQPAPEDEVVSAAEEMSPAAVADAHDIIAALNEQEDADAADMRAWLQEEGLGERVQKTGKDLLQEYHDAKLAFDGLTNSATASTAAIEDASSRLAHTRGALQEWNGQREKEMAQQGEQAGMSTEEVRDTPSTPVPPEAAVEEENRKSQMLDEMTEEQVSLAQHPEDAAQERSLAARRRAERSAQQSEGARREAEAGATQQEQTEPEGVAPEQERAEERSAQREQEPTVNTGFFATMVDRVRFKSAQWSLSSSTRELQRLEQVLRKQEEQLLELTGDYDRDDAELAGVRLRHKIPDRASIWKHKDSAEFERREARLKSEIAETRRQIEVRQQKVEARDKAAGEILERAAARADVLTVPHRRELADTEAAIQNGSEHLARYQSMLASTEQEIVQKKLVLQNATSSNAKGVLKNEIRMDEKLHSRLEKQVAKWEKKLSDLGAGRDRLQARIGEREQMIKEMSNTYERALEGKTGPASSDAAVAAAEAGSRAPEARAETPGDLNEFVRVWNARYGESLPLGQADMVNLVSAAPSLREIETAAMLKLGWNRGFFWKLPVLSWLWNMRTRRRVRAVHSAFNKQT